MITGKIVNIRPPDSTDQYGTQYQEVQIEENNTGKLVAGRIGSKSGYTGGEELTVNMEKRQDKNGQPFWYFKRVTDSSWGGQQASQGGSQGPRNAPKSTNGSDMVRIRSMALAYAKDLVVAEKVTRDELAQLANEFTAYIMTGRWIQDNPSQETNQYDYNPQRHPEDDIPF